MIPPKKRRKNRGKWSVLFALLAVVTMALFVAANSFQGENQRGDLIQKTGTQNDGESEEEIQEIEAIIDATGWWRYILEDGDATIVGCAMEPRGDLTIPGELDGYMVTGIYVFAFARCDGLTSVTIPDSVVSIGSGLFADCPSLTDIYVSPNNSAFASYDGILFDKQQKRLLAYPGARKGAYTIPEGIENVFDYAFAGCSSLTSVSIPNSVTSIESGTFDGCSGLTSVSIPNSVTSIGDFAFYMCSGLTSLTIPDSVTSIGDYAFYMCSGLTSLTIPDSVTSIGSNAFRDCTGLTSLTIPDSVTSIGGEAFSGCTGLTSVNIPGSVTSIGDNPFSYGLLEYIHVSSDNPRYAQIDGVLFDKQERTLISYPGAREGAYTIPDGILRVGENAFAGCRNLTGIVIPDSVTEIGQGAFYLCSALSSVAIGNNVTSIGGSAFSFCSSLSSVIIPDSVTSIGDLAFKYCYDLTSVTIGNSVTSIGEQAFAVCTSLTSVTIPEGVRSIGWNAFGWCDSLTTVTISDSVTSIDKNPFSSSPLTYIHVSSNNPRYAQIDGVLFDKQEYMLISYPGGREGAYTIPNGILRVGEDAFTECSNLTSIIIPNSVTSIGDLAFYACSGLTSLTIPDSVTSIGDWAFYGCDNLILSVKEGSYAEQYAQEQGIPFDFIQ